MKTTRFRKGSKLVAAIAVLMGTGLTCASCAKEEKTMTPREGRDQVVDFVKNTTAQTAARGWWPRNGVAEAGTCSLEEGQQSASYDYDLASPRGTDPTGDAQLVADYWKTLGMSVRIVNPSTSPTVFAEGGPVLRAMFETDASDDLYRVGAVAPCALGEADVLSAEDDAARQRGEVFPGDEGVVSKKDPRDRPLVPSDGTPGQQ